MKRASLQAQKHIKSVKKMGEPASLQARKGFQGCVRMDAVAEA